MSRRSLSRTLTPKKGDSSDYSGRPSGSTIYPASAQRARSVREQIVAIEQKKEKSESNIDQEKDQYDLTPLDDNVPRQYLNNTTRPLYSIDPFEFSGKLAQDKAKEQALQKISAPISDTG